MAVEEKIFPQDESEALPDELEALPDDSETWSDEPETLDSTTGSPGEVQARPWRYFIAGMGLTLLAVALGAVLGYLARPTLELATFVAAIPTTPAEAVIPVAKTSVAAPPTAQAAPNLITDLVQVGGHSQGASDAPVIIVEYSDFQCPYCGRHFREVEGRLKEAYVQNGQVRLVYKHYAILGQESVWAALASECAAEQNKFWEYHDLVFSRQNGENQGAFNPDNLKSWAGELGLDTASFDRCFDAQKYLNVVQANSAEAQQMGIQGTPGFFVNDSPVAGAQSFEVFQQTIEAELAEAGAKDGATSPTNGADAGIAVTPSTATVPTAVNASVGAAEPVDEQWDVEIAEIRGLGFSADGRQLIVAADDGLRIFADDQWLTPELPKHDYLGYSVTDDGFYSSGYPDPATNLVTPFGLVKSTDGGKTLSTLAFEGESDFSLMGVGYRNHAIYVFNSVPNSKLTLGIHYSLDDGQTWKESALRGIRSRTAQIAVHPTEANRVAIATEEGIFLSSDYGDTFELVNGSGPAIAVAFDPSGDFLFFGYRNLSVYDLASKEISALTTPAIPSDDAIAHIAVSPTKSGEIALATFLGDLHLSQDSGQTWQQLLQAGKGKSAR